MKRAVGAVAAAAVALTAIVVGVAYASSERVHTCFVVGKEQTVDVTSSSDEDGTTTSTQQVYSVYTSECGPFRIEDVWWRWQYDSAERYGAIREGSTYELTTLGWRVQWLGWYPNIIKLELIELPTV